MIDEPSLPSERPVHSRMSLPVAFGWVFCAAIGAQLTGALASGWVARAVGPDDLSSPLAASVIASTFVLLLVVWMAPPLSGVGRRAALGYAHAPLSIYAAAAIGTIALSPTGDRMMRLMREFFPDATLGTVAALETAALETPFLLALATFALMPGITEELLFRGVLQRAAGRGLRAIALSGIVFALFHLDPHHIAGVLPLGLFLAWLADRAGTSVSIVAHIANNAVAVTFARLAAGEVGHDSDAALPLPFVLGGLLVTGACVWFVARRPALA